MRAGPAVESATAILDKMCAAVALNEACGRDLRNRKRFASCFASQTVNRLVNPLANPRS